MAGSTQQHAQHTAPLAADDASINDDSFDNISLTSTVDDVFPPETEFAVEGIRAERIAADGNRRYLVEWTNFPLDQCTYEPEENLLDQLIGEWRSNQSEQSSGAAAEFEQRYEVAFNQKKEESRQRHRRRNAKRKRLGLAPTSFCFRGAYYLDSEDDIDQATESANSEGEDTHDDQHNPDASKDSSESEAEEDDQIDHKATEALVPSKPMSQTKPRSKPRQNRIFSFAPGQAAPKKAEKPEITIKQSNRGKAPSTSTEVRNDGPLPEYQTTSKQPSRPRELASITGYQGSARRSSSNTTQDRQSQPVSTSMPARPHNAPPAKARGNQLTARRTEQSVNIFTDGKTRKRKAPSNTSNSEKTENPQHFTTARALRRAELVSRHRSDQAPDLSKVHAFAPGSIADVQPLVPLAKTMSDSLDSTGSVRTVARDTGVQTSITLSTQPKQPIRTSCEPKSVLSTSKRSSLVSETGRSVKRAKSVRFMETDDKPTVATEPRSVRFSGADELFVSEPMEIDDDAESPIDSASIIKQSATKHVMLATSPNRTLNVTFNGVPRGPAGDNEPQWLKTFLDIGCLYFTHTVLAETLMSQFASLNSRTLEHLCSGVITSTEDNDALETIAEHLRTGRLGLFMTQSHFNLIIYPNKCDGFRFEDFGADFASSDGITLKYFAFTSSCPISRLIRTKTDRPSSSQGNVGQEMAILFQKILGVRLSQVVKGPSRPKHFFFAFPERALEWHRSFCYWLHQRDHKCKIYTNFEAGSWSSFVEKARQEHGVIIMHEAIVPFARRFPGISKLLQSDYCYVWRFSESPGLQIPPSLHNSSGDSVIPPVLSRIFALGTAILVTPSFMLSQPQETFKLFKWFFTHQARVPYNKLITAYNIRDYLYDLAAEKRRQNELLKTTQWRSMAALDVAMEKNVSAQTDEDIEATQRTWLEVDRWLGQQAEPNVPFSEENHVIYADQHIDPNDEQSLVNWFGWWALVRSETYRKFYIIGSDSSNKGTMRPGSQSLPRMSRHLKIPTYDTAAVNDPDESLRVSKKASPDFLERSTAGPAEERDRSAWLQNQRYFRNGEGDMKEFLKMHDRPGHTRIFRDPVSYFDMKMADHFGDPRMTCATYDQWWKWPKPWLRDPSRLFNTYIGFFYTIQQDWIPSSFPQGLKPRRHAWIAIYRPVEPHNKTGGYEHGRNELIIWDVRAGDKLERNHSIGLSELTWMQQELVRYVQLHAYEKMPNAILERVWLGGFQAHQSLCKSTSPMDKTAEFLELLSFKLKSTAPSAAMYLLSNGYRPVSLHQTLQPPQFMAAKKTDEDETGEDTRIIFHPPRGSATLRPTGTSNCTNDLFEASRLAKLRNPNAREMTYTYRPTMEWYEQQVAEGRQFEQIHVGEWTEMFKVLHINGSGKTPASATSEQSLLGLSRRSSTSSNHSSPKT